MTLLQDSITNIAADDQLSSTHCTKENSNTLPRARWNNSNPRKSRLPREGTIIIEGTSYLLTHHSISKNIHSIIV